MFKKQLKTASLIRSNSILDACYVLMLSSHVKLLNKAQKIKLFDLVLRFLRILTLLFTPNIIVSPTQIAKFLYTLNLRRKVLEFYLFIIYETIYISKLRSSTIGK